MRTPEQIIGHDALMQLIFEGYTVLPNNSVRGLKDCVEAVIAEPRRNPKIISRKTGDMEPLSATILKGQVLQAMRLLREIP